MGKRQNQTTENDRKVTNMKNFPSILADISLDPQLNFCYGYFHTLQLKPKCGPKDFCVQDIFPPMQYTYSEHKLKTDCRL